MFDLESMVGVVEELVDSYKSGERHEKDGWRVSLSSENKKASKSTTIFYLKDDIVKMMVKSGVSGRRLAARLLQEALDTREIEFKVMKGNCPYSQCIVPCRRAK